MPDVFVSYSRHDSDFVRELSDRVAQAGKQVWLDTAGIADGEVFPLAIRRAIEQSDSFLFVITPASIASSYCDNEVDCARNLHKRIVPVLREPVPDSDLPPEIRDRNWIPFTDETRFDLALNRLLVALDSDVEHRHTHTRWLVKALEWDAERRDRSFLLRGAELVSAESWLAGTPADADPAPTELQREYVIASRVAAARRQRTIVGASVVIAAVAIALLVVAFISRGQAVSERVGARSAALAAESQAQLPTDPEVSLILGMRAVRERATPSSLFALRAALDATPLQRGLPVIADPGSCGQNADLTAAVNPRNGQVAEAACNGRLLLLDPRTGTVERAERPAAQIHDLAFSPSGSVLAASTDQGVAMIDSSTGRVRSQLRLTRRSPIGAGAIAFSRDGRMLATDDPNGVTIWRLGVRRGRLLPDSEAAGNVTFSRDGRALYVGAFDGSVHVYDVRTGRRVGRITVPDQGSGFPELAAVSPDGSELAIAYPDEAHNGVVAIFDARSHHKLFDLTSIPEVQISALGFSPDGTRLVIGAEDGTAGTWSLQTREQLARYDGPAAAVTAMAFTPDGRSVVSASNDGVVRLWSALGTQDATVPVADYIEGTVFDQNRLEILEGAGPQRSLDSVSLREGGRSRRWPLGSDRSRTLWISPDGRFLLSTGPFGDQAPVSAPLRVYSVATHRLVRTLPDRPVSFAQFSPDDSHLITAEQPSVAPPRRFDVDDFRTGRSLTLTQPACPSNMSFAFDRSDTQVAIGNFCGVASVWNARTGRLMRRIEEGGQISDLDFSPDGRRLLISSWDSRATIWSLTTGRRLINLVGDTRGISQAKFSPDGSVVLTISLDDTARVWDAHTGQQLRVLTLPYQQAGFAFSPDGRRFALSENTPVLGADDLVRIYQTCPGCQSAQQLLTLARQRVTSRLTVLERSIVSGS